MVVMAAVSGWPGGPLLWLTVAVTKDRTEL